MFERSTRRCILIGVVVVAIPVVALLSLASVVVWENLKLAHSVSQTDVESLLGMPRTTYQHGQLVPSFGPRWDFHDLKSGHVVFADDMPPITDRACEYRGWIFDYLVYYEGHTVSSTYRVGAN